MISVAWWIAARISEGRFAPGLTLKFRVDIAGSGKWRIVLTLVGGSSHRWAMQTSTKDVRSRLDQGLRPSTLASMLRINVSSGKSATYRFRTSSACGNCFKVT